MAARVRAPAKQAPPEPFPLRCFYCGGLYFERVVTVAANAAKQVWDRCQSCQRNGRQGGAYISHKVAGPIEQYPIVEDYSLSAAPCEVCGALGTELHHWAPRYLFGMDAEKWPKSYLCKSCHQTWHDRVTPKMSEPVKASEPA